MTQTTTKTHDVITEGLFLLGILCILIIGIFLISKGFDCGALGNETSRQTLARCFGK